MPELPEVETVLRGLQAEPLWGHAIEGIRVGWERSVRPQSAAEFTQRLMQSAWTAIERRGKNLLIQLERNHQPAGLLRCHLRMTGKFFVCTVDAAPLAYERIGLLFANGMSLRFCDPRKFGSMCWIADRRELDQQLGPEPLDPGWTEQDRDTPTR